MRLPKKFSHLRNMEDTITFLEVCLSLLVGFAGAWLATKANRLATRTDILQVEGRIKQLESDISIATSGRLYMIEQQRKAVADLFTEYKRMFHHVYSWNILENIIDPIEAKRTKTEQESIIQRFMDAKSQFDMFITNADMIAAGKALFDNAFTAVTIKRQFKNELAQLDREQREQLSKGGSLEEAKIALELFNRNNQQGNRGIYPAMESVSKVYLDHARVFLRELK